jgi:predicted DCC family thiol-disulfide oxidoreductase YuxK
MVGLRERVKLSKAEVDRAVWVVTRDGQYYEAAAAINRVLQELPRWAWLARLYALPIIKRLEEWGYAWIATHRHHFARWYSAVPECERTGVMCVGEGK